MKPYILLALLIFISVTCAEAFPRPADLPESLHFGATDPYYTADYSTNPPTYIQRQRPQNYVWDYQSGDYHADDDYSFEMLPADARAYLGIPDPSQSSAGEVPESLSDRVAGVRQVGLWLFGATLFGAFLSRSEV